VCVGTGTSVYESVVRTYVIQPDGVPVYGPRANQPGKLEPFKPYLDEQMRAGVWNAQVLLWGLRERNDLLPDNLVEIILPNGAVRTQRAIELAVTIRANAPVVV
jgi:hypothetical protein